MSKNTIEVNQKIIKYLIEQYRQIAYDHATSENLIINGTKQRAIKEGRDPGFSHLIGYQTLAETIGYPGLKRHLGFYLLTLNEWCNNYGIPPLNALVVREGDETPGDGYPGGLEQWQKDLVQICGGWR